MKNFFAILACACFSLPFHTSLANSTLLTPEVRKRIEEVLRQEQCLDYAQLATSEWSRILEMHLVGADAKSNATKALRELRSVHAGALSTLEGFASAPLPPATTLTDMTGSLQTLQVEHARINADMDPVRKADIEFLRQIGTVEQALVDMTGILSRVPDSCAESIRAKLGGFATDANARREEATLARQYVAQASIRRERMLQLAYETKKAALLHRHSKATGATLAAVKEQLEGILIMGDLLPEFIRWKFKQVAEGYGDGEITFYLQYERGLANIASELEEAHTWRARLEAVKGVTAESKQRALAEADTFIADLVKARGRYEAMGWQGFLARQRLLVEAMRKIRHKYPPACGPLLDAFEASTREVPSLVSYRGHERFYKTLAKVCRVEPVEAPK